MSDFWEKYFADAYRNRGEIINMRRNIVRTAARQNRCSDDLQVQIDELRLMLASVIQLLIRSETIKPEELAALAKRLDALDGEADGRLDSSGNPDGTPKPPPESPLDDLADQIGQ